MIHPTFIRFGLLRVSLRSVEAALGPSDLSINAFTIFRSTSCFSLKIQPWSHQTLIPSLIYTHTWCSHQAHPAWCSLLFLLCHLSLKKCFVNSAQFITSCLLNPSSNSLSPACSQCKHSNAHLFASALCHIAMWQLFLWVLAWWGAKGANWGDRAGSWTQGRLRRNRTLFPATHIS